MNLDLTKFLKYIREYFNMMPDKTDEQVTIATISQSVSFRGANLWVLIFAVFLASLGLNVNSTAVIIGAMLISPLMGPILGMGLAIGINDFPLLRRSARNFGVATVMSVLTAAVYFLVSPFSEVQSELLARTSPTLFDVLIALFGGAAGIVAQASGGKGNVIPGVAIATALMPPLCTAGFGIATGNWGYFFGAFYLFYINTVFICIATFVGVKALRFTAVASSSAQRSRRWRVLMASICVATLIPAGVMTVGMIQKSVFSSRVKSFVDKELQWKGSRVISYDVREDNHRLDILIVGDEVSDSARLSSERLLPSYGLGGYQLRFFQGSATQRIRLLEKKIVSSTRDAEEYEALIQEMAQVEDSLCHYRRYDDLANDVRSEMAVLYPSVDRVGLSGISSFSTDTLPASDCVLALVTLRPGKSLSQDRREQMRRWLAERCGADSLMIVVVTP